MPDFTGAPDDSRADMADITIQLLQHLESLSFASDDGALPAVPPTTAAEQAAKGLRRLCEQASSAEVKPEQAALGRAALAALCDTPSTATLCGAARVATGAIDAIDRDADADVATCGLLRWGHLRINALHTLVRMASSEEGCVRVLEATRGEAAGVCVTLLASNGARTDLEGVRVAATLLRNLSLPLGLRPTIGALPGIFRALLRHVAHREPNTAAVVAATLRILVERCPSNAAHAVAALSAESGGGGDGGDGGGGSGSGDGGFGPILRADLAKMHPFCRVELARFISLTIAAACAESSAAEGSEGAPPAPAPDAQRALVRPAALQFGIFLLGSREPSLHREACAALLAARDVYERHGEAWAGEKLTVPSPKGDLPLAEVLKGHARTGSITADQVQRLCASEAT